MPLIGSEFVNGTALVGDKVAFVIPVLFRRGSHHLGCILCFLRSVYT